MWEVQASAMWSEGGEETRGGKGRGEMLWMQRKGTQEVEVSKHEEE